MPISSLNEIPKTKKMSAAELAICLETAISDLGVDDPEGTETVTFSKTLIEHMISVLRDGDKSE